MRYSAEFLLIVIAAILLPLTTFAGLSPQEKDQPQAKIPQDNNESKPNADLQDEPNELSDMELIERVEVLQRQLESPEIPKRDSAQKELIQLGIRVLDYLESTTEDTPSDAIQRTNLVRGELEKIVVASVTKASSVTLSGKMTVGKALERIRKQTNNDVALPEETPDVFLNQEIELDIDKASFWVALAEVMKQGDLIVDPYAGSRGNLRLVPTQSARMEAANPGVAAPGNGKKKTEAPRCVSEIFDLTVTQINASRNLNNPALNYCTIHMSIRWEPRVTPISLDLPTKSIKAIDEYDNPIEITNQDAVISGTVQPEISELEFSVPIALVDRQIEVIKSFDATIDAVVTGRTETFRFRKLGKLAPGAEQTKAGATVKFEGIQKNEDLFGVTVGLSFDEAHNALESHQSWVYSNEVYLENEAGERIDPLAQEGVRRSSNEIAIRYYFEPDPKDLTLFYKTPASIVKIPVRVSLKNIPLP